MPSRPNTTVLFDIYDDSKLPIANSPSPLISPSWESLLQSYPGDLPNTLTKILEFGTLVGYNGPQSLIISDNQDSVYLSPRIIDSKLQDDLSRGRIVATTTQPPFISSPLGLVPKSDGGFRRIHNLSHPSINSVNANISTEYSTLKYTIIEDILQMVRSASRYCIILKRDIKDAFRNIPVAPHVQWLLGFR